MVNIAGINLKQLPVKEHTRMLGVQLIPSLNWSSQVEKMITKVQSAVIKLVNTELTVYQAFMQFNTYLKPSVYYSAGII